MITVDMWVWVCMDFDSVDCACMFWDGGVELRLDLFWLGYGGIECRVC